MRYVITDSSGYYLAATSRSYGSQSGVGRVWTGEITDALTFDLRSEAEAVIVREFGDTARFLDIAVMKT